MQGEIRKLVLECFNSKWPGNKSDYIFCSRMKGIYNQKFSHFFLKGRKIHYVKVAGRDAGFLQLPLGEVIDWEKDKQLSTFFTEHATLYFFSSPFRSLPSLIDPNSPSIHCCMTDKSPWLFSWHVIPSLSLLCMFLFAGLWLSTLLESPHIQGCRRREDWICDSTVIHCHVEKVSVWAVILRLAKNCVVLIKGIYLNILFIFFVSYSSKRKILWFITNYTQKPLSFLPLNNDRCGDKFL